MGETIGYYREVVRLRPEDAPGCLALGLALAKTGDLGGAESSCRRAVTLAPDDPELRGNLGGFSMRRGAGQRRRRSFPPQ